MIRLIMDSPIKTTRAATLQRGNQACQLVALAVLSLVWFTHSLSAQELAPLAYNNPELTVDLGVGLWAWPMPIDADQDGDLDLVVASPDKPYNGLYLFENSTGGKLPVFPPARRLGGARQNAQLSWLNGQPQMLTPGASYPDFMSSGLDHADPLPVPIGFHRPVGTYSDKTRANQWRYVDYDGDGDHDLIVGIGDWSDYGWDDAFDSSGKWTHGPLHGFVYLLRNTANDASPTYDEPVRVQADDRDVDVYGWPTPNFADFDGDGDLDLLCGEFLDGFTYFANIGSRTDPRYAAGQRLLHAGQPIHMDLEMIVPSAVDWDRDGDVDLIVGDEDGR
ncbi:MAG: hypothetical protein KDA92_25895, partial [Planctomycetales bacterium]|nr:hypothetical protein [Planctomycetales bacterium]